MISLRHFRQVIDKFLKSPTAGNARVQIILPNGEFYDVNGIQGKGPRSFSHKTL
jgi:hypothetical protein